jgi:hypothetical protein
MNVLPTFNPGVLKAPVNPPRVTRKMRIVGRSLNPDANPLVNRSKREPEEEEKAPRKKVTFSRDRTIREFEIDREERSRFIPEPVEIISDTEMLIVNIDRIVAECLYGRQARMEGVAVSKKGPYQTHPEYFIPLMERFGLVLIPEDYNCLKELLEKSKHDPLTLEEKTKIYGFYTKLPVVPGATFSWDSPVI